MSLQLIERLADRALQFWLGGLEPCVVDWREQPGLATEPRIAQRFPAVFVRCARCVSIKPRAQFAEAHRYLLGRRGVERRENFSSQNRIHVHCVMETPGGAGILPAIFDARKRRRDGGATKPPSPLGIVLRETDFRYALAFAPSDAFACSTSCVNPAGSFTAISDSILRSISTPAAFSPCISWL